jgi:outer membrane lipoprotein SlyB
MIPRKLRPLLLFSGLWLLTGCSSMSSTDKGILGGGAIGAGTGAIIGSATGHAGAGAAIGTAVGAVSGGLIGNDIDETKKKNEAEIAAVRAEQAQTVRGPLSLQEIAQMAQQNINEPVIIGQIRSTRSIYNLTPNDIAWLKSQNVSDGVIMEMQATASRVVPAAGPARVYARPYYGPDVVYVEPYRPPPVGFGVTYVGGRRW